MPLLSEDAIKCKVERRFNHVPPALEILLSAVLTNSSAAKEEGSRYKADIRTSIVCGTAVFVVQNDSIRTLHSGLIASENNVTLLRSHRHYFANLYHTLLRVYTMPRFYPAMS